MSDGIVQRTPRRLSGILRLEDLVNAGFAQDSTTVLERGREEFGIV